MASYNKVILIGNLVRDVEVRYLQSGMAVGDMCLAVSDKRKSASGEWIEETSFVDITAWGRTAEVASEYLQKGSPAFIEGRLKLETWEKDGQKRSKLKVVCEKLQLIGQKPDKGAEPRRTTENRQPAPQDDFSGPPPSMNDDSIPF